MHLFLPAIALGLVAGLLAGGHFDHLAELPIRFSWILLGALLLRTWILSARFQALAWQQWTIPLQLLTFSLLLSVSLTNLHLPGAKVLTLGIGMNLLVMVANGGYMPVDLELSRATGFDDITAALEAGETILYYTRLTEGSRLAFLGDIILSPPLPRQRFVYSPGDLVMAAGLFWIVFQGLRGRHRNGDQPNPLDESEISPQ